ncbi:MAG: hypothetical protein K2L51_05180, partial [Clostridiales bacterium]|nr:hypothetical protein [Clostridiales bacterium]
LKWDAVAGATAGYVVRIGNSNDKIVGVSGTAGTQLDLSDPVVYRYFATGINDLAVKASATEKNAESAYSAAAQYDFTGSNEEIDTRAFAAAPQNVHIDGDTIAWTAFAGASNGYVVIVPKADGDGFKEYKTTATTVNLYAADVQAALGIRQGVAGSYMIGVKVAETDVYRDGIPYFILHYVAEVSEAQRTQDIAAAKTEMGALANALPDANNVVLADCEDYISSIATFLTGKYASYASYVTTDETVVNYKEKLDAVLAKAKETVEKDVDGLEEAIRGVLGVDYTGKNKEQLASAYNVLGDYQTKIDGFGNYGATYWAQQNYAHYVTDLADEQKTIEGVVVDTSVVRVEMPVAITNNASVVTLYAFVKDVNFRGESITRAQEPAVTVTQPAGAQKSVRYDAASKSWAVELMLTDVTSATPVSYNIDGKNFNFTLQPMVNDNLWTDVGTKKLVNNGKLTVGYKGEYADVPMYADVYYTAEAHVSGNAVTVKGAPVVSRISIANEMTEDSFIQALAKAQADDAYLLRGEVRLQAILYQINDNGAYTAINGDAVSEVLSYDISDEDMIARLPFGSGAGMQVVTGEFAGAIECGGSLSWDNVIAAFAAEGVTLADAEAVRAHVQFHVRVQSGGSVGDFYTPLTNNGWVPADIMRFNVYNLFKNETASSYQVAVGLAMREDSAYSNLFRESLVSSYLTWSYTVNEEDAMLLTWLSGHTGGKGGHWYLTDMTDPESKDKNIHYAWELYNNNKANSKGVAVHAYLVTNEHPATYDFVGKGVAPVATYTFFPQGDDGIGNIAWSDIDVALRKGWAAYVQANPAAVSLQNVTFVFGIQALASDEGKANGWLDSPIILATTSDNVTVDTKEYTVSDWKTPSGIQLTLTDSGYFEFIRTTHEGNESGNGSIFAEGKGVRYIVLKFTEGQAEHYAYLFAVDGGLYMYADIDAQGNPVGNALQCSDAPSPLLTDAYLQIVSFNDWVVANYDDIDSFDLRNNGCSLQTKIVTDGAYYIGEGEFSEEVTWETRNGAQR